MKAVILAGGLGTRISEESHLKPKPMIEIGERPILWHIMKIYSYFGVKDFIICLGYKGYLIKEYFYNYFLHSSDVTIDIANNSLEVHKRNAESWKITLVETGIDTMTGGRLKRVEKFIDNETFCMTYGDGVSNVNIHDLINFHKSNGFKATLTAVRPPGRYGNMNINSDSFVNSFIEKPSDEGGWINGGFFVLEPSVINLIKNDSISWENEPIQELVKNSELGAYKHYGFWLPMDTLRDKNNLQKLWEEKNAPWKIW